MRLVSRFTPAPFRIETGMRSCTPPPAPPAKKPCEPLALLLGSVVLHGRRTTLACGRRRGAVPHSAAWSSTRSTRARCKWRKTPAAKAKGAAAKGLPCSIWWGRRRSTRKGRTMTRETSSAASPAVAPAARRPISSARASKCASSTSLGISGSSRRTCSTR